MTAAKGLRRRRRAGADGIPQSLRLWFAGEYQREIREGAPLLISEAERAELLSRPQHSLNDRERRALGLPVEPLRPSAPWEALIFPDYALLPARWRTWKAEHPKARPPEGWEWIDEPEPFKGHAAQVAEACERKYLRQKDAK